MTNLILLRFMGGSGRVLPYRQEALNLCVQIRFFIKIKEMLVFLKGISYLCGVNDVCHEKKE